MKNVEYVFPKVVRKGIKSITDIFSLENHLILWAGESKAKDIFFLVLAPKFPFFMKELFGPRRPGQAITAHIFIGPPDDMRLCFSWKCFYFEDHTGSMTIDDEACPRGYKGKTLVFYKTERDDKNGSGISALLFGSEGIREIGVPLRLFRTKSV